MAASVPAPAPLDRRIAIWRAFHRIKNLRSCGHSHRGLHDRARRRSEIVALNRKDIDDREFTDKDLIPIVLHAVRRNAADRTWTVRA